MTNEELIEFCLDKIQFEPENEDVYKAIIQALEQTKWIPVSKKPPEEFAVVLCNTDSEEIFIATYLGKMNDGTDCFDDNDGMMWEGDIIAWMPLPEFYKPESEDEE